MGSTSTNILGSILYSVVSNQAPNDRSISQVKIKHPVQVGWTLRVYKVQITKVSRN